MPCKSSALAVIVPWTIAALAFISLEPAAWGQSSDQQPGRARIQAGPGEQAGEGEPGARPQREIAVPQLGPQLEKILRDWSNASAKIHRLEGEHIRQEFDSTFNTELLTTGKFYYTAPDRGMINFNAVKIKPGQKANRQGFTLSSGQSEIWACDGTRILQLLPDAKTGEAVIIPPNNRGTNIMDGPLPFLFGMPPEMAKQRYQMTLMPQTNETEVWLTVVPRWQVDAANYRLAKVLLERQNHYLPRAVELEDPAGTKSTLYKFREFKINEKEFLGFNADPLSDKSIKKLESGYQLKITDIGNAPPRGVQPGLEDRQQQPGDPQMQPAVQQPVAKTNRPPHVIGFDWEAAGQLLERAGYEVKFLKGDPAPKAELVYRVQDQKLIPPNAAGAKPTIQLVCYVEMQKAENTGDATEKQ